MMSSTFIEEKLFSWSFCYIFLLYWQC